MRFLLAFLLCLLPVIASAQEDDRGRLTRFLEDNLSGAGRQITIEGFRGALSARATIDRLSIADDAGEWLSLTGVVLDWNRLAVLSGNIQINELSAREVVLTRPPLPAPQTAIPSPEATPFALPDLPVAVDIGRISADRVVLGEAVLGQEVVGTLEAAMRLSGGEGNARLRILRQDAGPDGTVELDASYSNITGALVINLDAAEGPGGIAASLLGIPGTPEARLQVQGAGPLTNFAADVALTTDGQDRLAGRVTLEESEPGLRAFSADLGGDLAPLFLPDYAEFFGTEVRLVATGTRADTGRLDLSRLSVAARALSLEGALIMAADGMPERLSLTGRLGLPSGEPVLLPLSTDQRTRVAAADLSVGYDAAQGDGWTARAIVQQVERYDITIDRLALTGSGRITRGADLSAIFGGTIDFAAEGLAPADPTLAMALGDRIDGQVVVTRQGDEGGLQISSLRIGGADYALTLRGVLDGLTSGFRFDGQLGLSAADLSRFAALARQPLAGAIELDAAVGGSPLGGDFDITGQATGTDLAIGQPELDALLRGASTLRLSVRRDETGTQLRDLTVEAGPARLAARGTLVTLGSDLTAELDFPDLGVLDGPYRGALDAALRLTGTIEDARVTLRGTGRDLVLGIPEADGLLRGQTALDIAITRVGERIGVETAILSNPQGRINATGHYDPAGSDLTADFTLASLATLGPRYGGALSGRVRATGTPEDANLTLRGTSRDLAIGIAEADGLLRGETALDIAITRLGDRIGIQTANLSNPQARINATGHYDPAGSDLSVDLALADLGALGPRYRGALSAQVQATGTPEAGTLALTGEGRALAIGQAEADRLLAGTSTVRLRLSVDGGRIRIEDARIANPQITAEATGLVNGDQRRVDLTARLANLGLILPDFPGALSVNGTLTEDSAGYGVDLRAQGPGQIDATARGRLAPALNSGALRIAGTAQAALANVFLGSRVISGALNFDLGLNGPFALSSLSGPVRLTGGRLADPDLPFALTDIAATATLAGARAQIDASAALTTGGQLTVAGSAGLAAPYPSDLTIALNGVRLRDPELYETTLNGALTLRGPIGAGGLLSGRILLDETELRVPSTGLGGAGALPDLRHLNEPAPVRTTRLRAGLLDGNGAGAGGGRGSGALGLDLTILAPNRVFIRGRGLDAELGGEVRVQGTTANVVPSGALNLIRGRLDILGKRLTLTTARLDLQGGLLPYIEVVAANDSDGITTFVRIEGPTDAPEITFSSSPELPQEEVLARLLFDRGLQNISALQAAQLASAVATLAGRGGDGIIGRLRKGFGLDDLDLSTSATGETSLRLGKYISENVYTEVEVDQAGKSRISLNLDIRPGLTVKGRVASDGEAGLGVFLERDY